MDLPNFIKRYVWAYVGAVAALAAFSGMAYGAEGFFVALALALGIAATLAICFRPWISVVLIAFALPFERVASIDVAGFTLRISQLLLGITIAVVVAYALAGKLRIKLSGVHIPLLLFAIGAASALPASVNRFRGLTSFGFMVFTALLVIVIPTLIRNKRQLFIVLLALLCGAGLTAAFGLFQFAGDLAGLPPSLTGLRDLYTKEVFGFPRIQSTALEPLYFANFLLLPIALSIVLLLRKQRNLLTLAILVLAAALPAFVLTLSRAAYIALALMLFLVAVLCFRHIFSPSRIILIACLIVVTFFAVNYALSLTGDKETTVATFVGQATNLFVGASYADRVGTNQQAIDLVRSHPFGVGPGNFGPSIAVNPKMEPIGGWLIVNNIYLEVLCEEGIIGLAGFLAFLVVVVLRIGKAALTHADPLLRSVAIACAVAIVAISVQYLTFSILYIMHIWFAFGLAIAVSRPLPESPV